MAYTPPTSADVLLIYKRSVETTLVDEAIDAATSLMTALELTDDVVGLWLSAHFTAVANNDPQKEKALGVEAEYSYMGKGLDATRYGQQAIILDTTGTLGAMLKGKTIATIEAL